MKEQNSEFPFITVSHIKKRFDQVTAVNDISFSIKEGELFGFLGPNGAGKTTTIQMLTGLARADSGEIRIGGFDCRRNPKAAQHLIGVVPDESSLYPELTGYENLTFCASLYGITKEEREQRSRQLLKTFNLQEAAHRKFGGYSKGMKRKLTIAAGIVHHPHILFLDEPTTGIDVASARQIRQLIKDLHDQGTTIFLTTHYIEEAERLCGRIAFIVDGKIVRDDSVANLIQPIMNKHVMMLSISPEKLTDTFHEDFEGLEVQGKKTEKTDMRMRDSWISDKLSKAASLQFPDISFRAATSVSLRAESDQQIHAGSIVRFLEEQGAEVIEARIIRPSLEDIFVEVTGIELDNMKREKEKSGGQQ